MLLMWATWGGGLLIISSTGDALALRDRYCLCQQCLDVSWTVLGKQGICG